MKKIVSVLLALVTFAIPVEHRYDKPLRHLSLKLIPKDIVLENFDKKIFFFATDIAAIALFALLIFAWRIPLRRLLFEKGAAFLWILFACAAASIAASPLAHYSVLYTRLLGLFSAILLFCAVANSDRQILTTRTLFSLLLAAALFQSAIAIAQYFKQAPLGLTLLSEPRIATGVFSMQGGTRWFFDKIFGHENPTAMIVRSCGTFLHCNILGSYLSASILATYSLISFAKKKWARSLLALTLPIQVFALGVTFSRSAIFALAIGTIVWFAYAAIRGKDRRSFFLATSIAVSFALSAFLLSDQYLQRGGVVNYVPLNQASDAIRIRAQNLSLEMIRDHPFLGVGFNEYTQAARQYLPQGKKAELPHNVYLLIATETGLISLAAYLGFLLTLFWRAARAPFSLETASLLSILAAFLFIGCCDFTPYFLQPGRMTFFLAAALLAHECYKGMTIAERLSPLPEE